MPLRFAALLLFGAVTCPAAAERPNIVVIVSDDAGYADFSMQGSKQIETPRIDSIAQNGVRFTSGYVSGCVCSPTRAGIMTGRYQQRFGHEFNVPPVYSEENGLPVEETTIAKFLQAGDYRTIALGKWHLGYAPHFHPLSRGFDDYFGFLQGARSYWPGKGTKLNELLRDREPVEEKFDYMTLELGRQTAAYIEKHREDPFFIYLAFNAVHTPMHAREEDLREVPANLPQRRRELIAMTHALDSAVGLVLDELKKQELYDNTLVFFVNDNGGATTNASGNAPLRGHKGQMFDGGIRVPFALQWPAKLPRGKEYDHPVIGLDILPTALAAAGIEPALKNPLDGVNLLPFLTGKEDEPPHAELHWKAGANWAIRQGDWKLLRQQGVELLLCNLAEDVSESENLAAREPERVEQLQAAHEAWAKELVAPRWGRGARERD